MNAVIWMIEVNTTEDTREPERWLAMNQPSYSLADAREKLKRLRVNKMVHGLPRRIAKYQRVEVEKE